MLLASTCLEFGWVDPSEMKPIKKCESAKVDYCKILERNLNIRTQITEKPLKPNSIQSASIKSEQMIKESGAGK